MGPSYIEKDSWWRMKPTDKGDLLEKIVKSYFEEELSYTVFQAQRITQRIGRRFVSKKIDIFGCDLIGICCLKKTLFCQVTANSAYTHKMKLIREQNFNLDGDWVLFARYRKTKNKNGIIFYVLNWDGWTIWKEVPIEFFIEKIRKNRRTSLKSISEWLGIKI